MLCEGFSWTGVPANQMRPTEIGKTATELLLQRINNPERLPREVVLKSELIVRGSSAPRNPTPAN